MTELPDFDLTGRVAIVTGASSGFGARFTRVLAAAGATVVAAARRVERLEELAAEVPGVTPIGCDVTDPAQVEALVARTVELHGRIDIVVNNAGASDAPTPAVEESREQFAHVVDVNLTACFHVASLAARHMIDAGRGGSVINISSIHGTAASAPNHQAAYVASKAGLIGLTKELAGQWARHGVRVNAIAPGYFETELTEEMFSGEHAEGGQRYIQRGTMLRRAGVEGELDGALLLLAGDAGSYLTGETITVDGGWLAK